MKNKIKKIKKWILVVACIAIFFIVRDLAARTTGQTLLVDLPADVSVTIRREVIGQYYIEETTEQPLTQKEQTSFLEIFSETKLSRCRDEFWIRGNTRYYISIKEPDGKKVVDIKIFDEEHLDCHHYNEEEGMNSNNYRIYDTRLFEFLKEVEFAETYQEQR